MAIAFAGRARERSLGEHTAGFSTSNGRHQLPDGAALHLCEGIEADRSGKLYPEGLDPDEKVPAPDTCPQKEMMPYSARLKNGWRSRLAARTSSGHHVNLMPGPPAIDFPWRVCDGHRDGCRDPPSDPKH